MDVRSADNITMYRIGEFAKYLGVTPDFLKHYESLGIINSVQGENGYRYYSFQESNKIFECIKLKNLGFTIRESKHIINELSEAEILEKTGQSLELVRKEVLFKQTLLDNYSDFMAEMSFAAHADSDWSIRSTEPMLFLPHSRARQFIDDRRIYEILPEWMKIIPIVRSAALISPERPASSDLSAHQIKRTWGMIISKRHAEKLDVPVNSAVIELPSRKALHYHFSARQTGDISKAGNYHEVWKKLDELGMQPADSILSINNLAAHNENGLAINQHFIVPLLNVR